jgi:hypothetical protein
VNIVCEVIEGAGPSGMPGDLEPEGKAERLGTAQRLDGDPRDLIRAMSTRETTPEAVSFSPGLPIVPCSRNDRYPYTAVHRGAARRPPGRSCDHRR